MARNAIPVISIKRYWKQLVIVVAAIVLGSIFILQLLFAQREHIYVRIKGSPGNWWWVTPRPPDWLANSIKVGDKEYNASNRPITEIMSVDVYDAGGSTRDVYVTAKIEVRKNRQTNKYSFKGEPVEIGGPISMSLDTSFFPGMVVAIYDDMIPRRAYTEKTVLIRYNKRWPYEFSAFQVGDTIMDGSGEVIAEILSKERKPSETEVVTITGSVVKAFSPVYDDFFVTVKIKGTEVRGEYIFREEQYLKVGNQVWLMFPGYNMSGASIVSIQ
jgi:hypothetical protein